MKTKSPAPGFINHPEHHVQIVPSDRTWIVRAGDTILAESRKALVVEETG